MKLKQLYDPENGRMRVVGFMSGSGSNLREIIQYEARSSYEVVAIFSDNPASNALRIGSDNGIPVVIRDLNAFYKIKGKPTKDLEVRKEFDLGTVEALRAFGANVAAYAGYMRIVTSPLINAFLGVNVHPADLTIMAGEKRKYTGDNAVRDAILAGEKNLRATTHIVEPQVDGGRILMLSNPLQVTLPYEFDSSDVKQVASVAKEHQDRLKEAGDWVIFPRTLECIADGRYSQDENGNLYFDNKPIPQGLMLENA